MFENFNAFDYIVLGIAAPFILILSIFIIVTILIIAWPILLGLSFVYLFNMPEGFLFLFGIVTFIWWILLASTQLPK